MRDLRVAECAFVSGGVMKLEDDPGVTLDDIFVTATRASSGVMGFFRDFFGFDSGRFHLSDIGLGNSGARGHIVVTGGPALGGAAVAIPVDEEGVAHFGVVLEAEFDPRTGDIGVTGPGVSYDPGGVDAGYNGSWNGMQFWVPTEPQGQGIGLYLVPDGYGEMYWGLPPGHINGPYPQH